MMYIIEINRNDGKQVLIKSSTSSIKRAIKHIDIEDLNMISFVRILKQGTLLHLFKPLSINEENDIETEDGAVVSCKYLYIIDLMKNKNRGFCISSDAENWSEFFSC